MCDKHSFQSGHDEIPKPRTAEQLRKAALELQDKKQRGMYMSIQEDYFR